MPENKATQVKVRSSAKLGNEKLPKGCKLNNSKGSHGAGANMSAKQTEWKGLTEHPGHSEGTPEGSRFCSRPKPALEERLF